MQSTDKLDIAIEILEAAIVEYLDHDRKFAAYNLAAVAEELLGKLVRLNGVKDSTMETIEAVKLVSKVLDNEPITDKEWSKIIFDLKNSIKHMDSENQRFIEVDISDEVSWQIIQAVQNYDKLGLGYNSLIERFYKDRQQLASQNKHIRSSKLLNSDS